MSAPIDAPAPEPIDDEVEPPPPVPDEDLGLDDEEDLEPDDLEFEPKRTTTESDSPEPLLVPKIDPVIRVLWSENRNGVRTQREYLQAPLNVFPKIELYGILGRAMKIVLEADTGVDVQTLLDMTNPRRVVAQLASRLPGAEDAPLVETASEEAREMDAMKIMAAFAEVVSVAPDLLKEAYCVILNVPKGHREWAILHALDNIDDDEGFDILETFIDQSWPAIEGFFTRWLPQAAKRTVQARQRAAEAKRRSSGTSSRR